MLQMHPSIFTLIILGVAFFAWYFGWKQGHISGHYCERQSRGLDDE